MENVNMDLTNPRRLVVLLERVDVTVGTNVKGNRVVLRLLLEQLDCAISIGEVPIPTGMMIQYTHVISFQVPQRFWECFASISKHSFKRSRASVNAFYFSLFFLQKILFLLLEITEIMTSMEITMGITALITTMVNL